MDWFFDGLGTLLIGLLLGGTAGGAAGWKVGVAKTSQRQRARDNSTQVQIAESPNDRRLGPE